MESAALAPLGPLLEFETRFLWPFFYNLPSAADAAECLSQPRPGRWPQVWELAAANSAGQSAYQDELLGHVGQFFFSTGEGGRCLRVPADAASAWFKKVTVDLDAAPRSRLELVSSPGIEVFLTNWGVGVLSLTLSARQFSDPLAHADFDYRLSRLHGGGAPLLRTVDVWPTFLERQLADPAAKISHPHRAFLEEQLQAARAHWEQLPEAQRLAVEQSRRLAEKEVGPADNLATPLPARLGAPGGLFSLPELQAFLLAPLAAHGLDPAQENFSVYTVARFGDLVDFNDHAVRRAGALLISRLAQVEERHHAGNLADEVCVPSVILNPRHFAAVGLLGAAHVVSDQPPEAPGAAAIAFNEQRLPRVRDKYFVPYLLALVQTHVLQRTAREAAVLVRQSGQARDEGFEQLCQRFREFSVGGNFSRASTRAALHRFYQVARQGLDVPAHWQDARQTLGDLDDKFEAVRERGQLAALQQAAREQAQLTSEQRHLASSMDESLRTMIRLQLIAKMIEVFVISVYCAHLTHMLWPGVYALASYGWGDAHTLWEAKLETAQGGASAHAGPEISAELLFQEAVHEYHEGEHRTGFVAVALVAVVSLVAFWYFIVMRHHPPPATGPGHEPARH